MHATGPSTGEDDATFEPGKKTKNTFSLFYPIWSCITMGSWNNEEMQCQALQWKRTGTLTA